MGGKKTTRRSTSPRKRSTSRSRKSASRSRSRSRGRVSTPSSRKTKSIDSIPIIDSTSPKWAGETSGTKVVAPSKKSPRLFKSQWTDSKLIKKNVRAFLKKNQQQVVICLLLALITAIAVTCYIYRVPLQKKVHNWTGGRFL